jgi:hypothetical protein
MTQTQVIPEAYKLALQAKVKRDRQSFAEFRKIDQELFDADRKRQLESRINEFRENIRVYQADITEWEHDAAKALDLFTLADEHAAAAEKYALEMRQAWELVRGDRLEDGRAPDEVAEAEIGMEKASKVAAARRGEADRARISLEETLAALAAQRSGLAGAERQLAGLEKALDLQVTAPLSEVTARTFKDLIASDEQIRESLSERDITRAGFVGMGLFQEVKR